MKQLDVSLGLHHEICLFLCALGKEGYAAVKDVNLLSFLTDELRAIGDEEATDDHIADYRQQYGHQGKPGLLFKTLYEHVLLSFLLFNTMFVNLGLWNAAAAI